MAAIVLAHLEAMQTRDDPARCRAAKVRLIKGLFARGLNREAIRQLFRLIDWLIELPPELARSFGEEIYRFEQEQHMPYVTSIERMAREDGKAEGFRERQEKGRQEGEQKGRQEGEAKGRQEGMRAMALTALEVGLRSRFSGAGLALLPRLQGIQELTILNQLLELLWQGSTLEDFQRQLP
jgi:hypothetical protein